MTTEELRQKLVDFSPFTLEVTNDKFDFNTNTVVINNGTPIYYDILQTTNGLEIKIESGPMNFFNLIVVFGQNQTARQIVNFDYQKLALSFPSRGQFIGLVSNKIV